MGSQFSANFCCSVVAHVHFDVELGDIIEMELLRRHKDMRAVAPLHSHEANDEWKHLYSKVLVMSLAEVRLLIWSLQCTIT